MEKVHVTIAYESQEPGGIKSVDYILTKTLEFKKLPGFECWIELNNDAIPGFRFQDVSYDPDKDMYFVTNDSDEGVERYYHGDAKEIMSKVIERYKRHGWKVRSNNGSK